MLLLLSNRSTNKPSSSTRLTSSSEIASLNISGFLNIVYHKGNPVDFLSVSKSNSTENFFATVFRNLLEPYRSILRGPNICNKDSLIEPGETTPKALTTYPKSLKVYISTLMSSDHYEDIPSPPSRLLSSIALTIKKIYVPIIAASNLSISPARLESQRTLKSVTGF